MSTTLLKADAIAAMPGLQKTHFLNDDALRVNKSLGDATGLLALGVHLIEVPPGKWSTEYHRHWDEEECTYVIQGTGEVIIGDATHAISAGDFIAYPAQGEAHTMQNTGKETLVCLVVGQRLPCDTADFPNKKLRIYRRSNGTADLVAHAQITHPDVGRKT